MTKQEHIAYWLSAAKLDLRSMGNLFASKEYQWSLFIGHLALEKLLKAVWVRNNEGMIPPKTHNLLVIAEQALVSLSIEEKELLSDVNEFNIETRYPDYKFDFYKKSTKEFAEKYITKIKELFYAHSKYIE